MKESAGVKGRETKEKRTTDLDLDDLKSTLNSDSKVTFFVVSRLVANHVAWAKRVGACGGNCLRT